MLRRSARAMLPRAAAAGLVGDEFCGTGNRFGVHFRCAQGRLVDLQWKLGIGMSSNLCNQLNSPFVMVFLKVRDDQGQLRNYSFELSLPEFQTFAKQFRDIADVIS